MQTALVTQSSKPARGDTQSASWRFIYLLNFYSLALSSLRVSLYFGDFLFKPLGRRSPGLFIMASAYYTSATNWMGLGLYISRQPADSNQAHLKYLVIPTGSACFRIRFQDSCRNIN